MNEGTLSCRYGLLPFRTGVSSFLPKGSNPCLQLIARIWDSYHHFENGGVDDLDLLFTA